MYLILILAAVRGRSMQFSPLRLRIRVGGVDRDWWVADAMEVAALWEVFIAEEYGDWLPPTAGLIIDAGANVGTATAWFRQRFPEARVIAVEPNPSAVQRLRRNVGEDPYVEVVQAALSDSDGVLGFASNSMTILGHVVDESTPGVVPVEALTLNSLRERFAPGVPVDVLKIDTEGSEWRILKHSLAGVQSVVLEVHEPVPNGRTADDVLSEVALREGLRLRQGHAKTMAQESLRWLTRDAPSD